MSVNSDQVKGPLRILMVDDNADAARTQAILLKRLGHEVQVCESASAALELLESLTVDVAILDIGLPEMDGCELAQRIRMMPEMQHATLIALTGYSQESDGRRFREVGFNKHLVKPAGIEELKSVLSTIGRNSS